ncbi:MAG: primosomal protein N' [Bacteroidales bacterium]|nr:primosomal protein N' [Bacteroidales bacterium]
MEATETPTYFVDVILPLHLPDTYTYRLPREYNGTINVGQRVVVQFGTKRLYSALVRRIHTNVPEYKTKYVLSILDVKPIVSEFQFRFWEWMATYYMCYPGDVMAVAIPSAFRLSSESYILVHPDYDGDISSLNEDELKVVELLLRKGRIEVSEVIEATGHQKIMPLLNTLIEKRVILMDEELKQRYTPKKSAWLELDKKYLDQSVLHELFDELEKRQTTQKQLLVLMQFLQLTNFGKDALAKKDLTDNSNLSTSALESLIKKRVLHVFDREESRLKEYDSTESVDNIKLSDEQQQALDAIITSDKHVCLLHGVTSSGKTEVYIRLIERTIKEGKQVLFLLPEIALTAQIINRLRRYFGNAVGVYHSRFSTQERAEIWHRVKDSGPGEYKIVLGARSALFLPYHNLGLIIVDEEHDSSYKQNDPAPRYNGRDSAIYLASLWNARTVLGSATPSIESYYNASNGKYGFAEMKHRYGGTQLPEVMCADMKEATRKKEVKMNFSKFLLDNIGEALKEKEQVILFQNRRGFSLRLECDVCHHIPECKYCDVSLVYHKATNSLRCHYCGYSIPVPKECPACHSSSLRMRGFGTERIEDDLSIFFPEAHVERMDLDTTMQKKKYHEILNDFEDHKIDILVGTQMVTKGLDFDNVGIVGIMSADNLISYPDFRAYERSFQLMTQVSGRAGRRGKQGKVIIQTYQPYHQAIRDAMNNDYMSMYSSQITERRVFKYPPFYKLVDITLRHADKDVVDNAAAKYVQMLRSQLGARVLGPEYPSVSRIRNKYIKKAMVRFAFGEAIAEGKRIMQKTALELLEDKAFARVQILFDVDPR